MSDLEKMKYIYDNSHACPVNGDCNLTIDTCEPCVEKIWNNAIEEIRADERNEIIKELGNQLTQANCEQGIEFVMSRIRYVLGEEQKNDC